MAEATENKVALRLKKTYCLAGAQFCAKELEAAWKEIEAIESHAKNLATACAWAMGALPNGSVVTESIARILTDYNERNT